MKKILLILWALILVGCTSTTKTPDPTPSVKNPVDVRVTSLSGPTTMGLVKMLDDSNQGVYDSNNFIMNIAKSPDELVPLVAKGEVDIALIPSNLAAILFQNTKGNVQVLTINTLGVLYIVENGETIQSINDLAGKTVCATGKGATPDVSINHILSLNGLEDQVTLEFKSAPSECIALMEADKNTISMLPEPFVTTAITKNEELRVALDLTKEWNKVETNGELITGVTVVNKTFAKENPEAVEDFLNKYEKSVEYTNNQPEDAAKLIAQYKIAPEPVALKAIPNSNITFITGDKMKESLNGYLQILYNKNPKLVGGAMPTEDFYYD